MAARHIRPIFDFQLSTFNYQLLIISYQSFAFCFQSFTWMYLPPPVSPSRPSPSPHTNIPLFNHKYLPPDKTKPKKIYPFPHPFRYTP